ncbi:MAG: bacterial capsule synthesis cap family protein [Bacillales bacterium]|jgi:poly-gamma-glutamate synthesis protein (capsule biosynthesis protein)|nr:bacterial capsule synthesis cap family protein [Bacillales bacterium]
MEKQKKYFTLTLTFSIFLFLLIFLIWFLFITKGSTEIIKKSRIKPVSSVIPNSKPLENPPINTRRDGSTIKLIFAGDTCLDVGARRNINKYGVDYPFHQVKDEVMKADFSFLNLETSVTERTTPYPKEYNYKSTFESLQGITNAGFDLVGLSNNHSMDYGLEGLIDTFENLKKASIPYIGAGRNSSEAYQAHTEIIKGKKIKFLSFSNVLPDFNWFVGENKTGLANGYDINLIVKTVQKEKETADHVFVYIHWGVERTERPLDKNRTWARQMIDAGASGVIGSHPHVLQGFEVYKGKPIAYSIGNFVFGGKTGLTAQTGLLQLNILPDDQIIFCFSPYIIENFTPMKVSEEKRQSMLNYLESISYGVDINKQTGFINSNYYVQK